MMSYKTKTLIFRLSIIACAALMVFGSIWVAVKNHIYDGLYVLAFLASFAIIGIIGGRLRNNTILSTLLHRLSADHKLITPYIAAVDVGNFRFLFNIYEKGSVASPTNKSYLSLTVNIPFPVEEDKRESIKIDLQALIDRLNGKGVLSDSNLVFSKEEDNNQKRVTWIGHHFFLEFQTKGLSPVFLADLQTRLLEIINKYDLQELEFSTIHGFDTGTEYRFIKGNMRNSLVDCKDYSNSIRFSHKCSSRMYLTKYESLYDRDQYLELFASARDLEIEYTFESLQRQIRDLFKNTNNGANARSGYDKDGFTVTITIPKRRASSIYHITQSTGYWWIYSAGRLNNIEPISTEDLSSACHILFRVISKYSE